MLKNLMIPRTCCLTAQVFAQSVPAHRQGEKGGREAYK
jgi:hypothetical protein